MGPLEILRRTPKNNCGRCGYPTCLAFAAAVAREGEEPSRCPIHDRKGVKKK
jgi:Na+-translocating ferredoxin:NAD+ oxidoreductase RNF subunit RnfB